MDKKPLFALTTLLCVLLAACIFILWKDTSAGLLFSGLSLIAALISVLLLHGYTRDTNAFVDDMLNHNSIAATRLVNSISVPCVLFNERGRIVWRNEAFAELYSGSDIKGLLPQLDPHYPDQARSVDVKGKNFQVMSMSVRRDQHKAHEMTFQYWLDRTEAQHYSRLYEEQRPTVALICVDNYEGLVADRQFKRNSVLSEVERYVGNFVESINGIYRRYDDTRFLVVFETQYLDELEKNRFPLLDEIHKIDTGTDQPVTLSIAVGVASRINESDEYCQQALEMALGRGGDQAVVKHGTSYSFYGGKRQVTTRQSRVKTRLFAKALRQLLENSTDVFIMGHKQADMDCIGAAMGLLRCAKFAGCDNVYIILEENNPTIEAAVNSIRGRADTHDAIKTADQARAMLRPGSVLIIVDTQRESFTPAPELLKLATKTVVIDHHRRSVDAIESPTLSHLEAGASSASEMVAEILQYFDDDLKPTSFECSMLLAGITVDTKNFAFNVGSRTFDAAGYLRKNGADTAIVREMFQDDMQIYKDRTAVVQQAELLPHGIALSVCPGSMENASLIAAQAADELVSIKGIKAAFVLAETEDGIVVSGRSLGHINVQVVLEKVHGGGHLTMAGAQLGNISLAQGVKLIKDCINEYIREVKI